MTTAYRLGHLPNVDWGYYMRIVPFRAVRMTGPFRVWTPAGIVHCENGWLALDAKGNPYAISAEEFERKCRPTSDVFIYTDLECEDHDGECDAITPFHPRQSEGTSRALAVRA